MVKFKQTQLYMNALMKKRYCKKFKYNADFVAFIKKTERLLYTFRFELHKYHPSYKVSISEIFSLGID
jgi:hypothetical protein